MKRPCAKCRAEGRSDWLVEARDWERHRNTAHRTTAQRYRSSSAWKRLRAAVIRRDGGRCRRCGSTANLEVHHIRGVPVDGVDDPALLITLCQSCHPRPRVGDQF